MPGWVPSVICIGLAIGALAKWSAIPERVRRWIRWGSGFSVVAVIAGAFSPWQIAGWRLEAWLQGLISGCALLLVGRGVRRTPEWLIVFLIGPAMMAVPAVVLVIAAIIFVPSANEQITSNISMGGNYFYERRAYDADKSGAPGVDLTAYERHAWFPFLVRGRAGASFGLSNCRAETATLTMQADGKHVLAKCPGAQDQLVPLR